MAKQHHYQLTTVWTGNLGQHTQDYRAYSRNHDYRIDGKPVLAASSDPAFRGDPKRHNPEDLLLAAVSGCHMLWYLHLCAEAGIAVQSYEDQAEGTMLLEADGRGYFSAITLKPQILLAKGDIAQAEALHAQAHHYCFIANSLNFEVQCHSQIRLA